jgi:hypothetical protein
MGQRVHIKKERATNVAYRHDYIHSTADLFCPVTHLPLMVVAVSDESYCNMNHTRRLTWYNRKRTLKEFTGAGKRWNIIGMATYSTDWDNIKTVSNGKYFPDGKCMQTRRVVHGGSSIDEENTFMINWDVARGHATKQNASEFLRMEWVRLPEEGDNTGPRMWETKKDAKRAPLLEDYHLNVDQEYYETWFAACLRAVEQRWRAYLVGLDQAYPLSPKWAPADFDDIPSKARGEQAAALIAEHRAPPGACAAQRAVARAEIARQLRGIGFALKRPLHRAAHLIDGASSHVRCADRAPTSGSWRVMHAYLASQDVDPAVYTHLKPLSKPKGWVGDWVGGGDPATPGKKPAGMRRWVYADALMALVNASKPAELVREVRKMAQAVGQRVHYTPPYHPELQPIEKFWLHAKDPVSRDPQMRKNMTILNGHLRAGFDSLPAARKTWCSAWRKTGEAYRQYIAQMPEESESLILLSLAKGASGDDEELSLEDIAALQQEEDDLQLVLEDDEM